jgi:hypothetical protein
VGKGEHVKGIKILYPETEGLTISGRVIDTEGRPIRRATVILQGPGWQQMDTDANGQYELTGLSEGEYTLRAASYSYSSSESVTAEAGSTHVNIVLKGLATIEGQVVSRATGEPVEAFRVRAKREGGNVLFIRDDWVHVRGAGGRFRLTGVEAGPVSVEVLPEGYAAKVQPVGTVSGGETLDNVVIRVDNGGTLTGRVVDGQGHGVSSAMLFVGAAPDDQWNQDREKRTVSGPDGAYEITSLPAGAVTVIATHAQFARTSVDVHVTPSVINRRDIVLSSGGTVTGVITLDGKPMPDQEVHVSFESNGHKSAPTDSDGRYEIGGLPDGGVRLNPTIQGDDIPFQGKLAHVEVSSQAVVEMDFDFRSGTSTIEGVVYEGERDPIGANTHVQLNVDNADGTSDYKGAMTDPAGRYFFEAVPSGVARLTVHAQNLPSRTVTIEIGERERIERDIHLYGGSALHVVASGAGSGAGQSVTVIAGRVQIPELSVELFPAIAQSIAGSAQLVDGRGTVNNLEAGTYTVLAVQVDLTAVAAGDPLAGAKFGTATVEMPSDGELTVNINLR